MSDEELLVADNLVVRMQYELRLDDGRVISRAENDNPLEYIHGAGQIISGLENALYGMAVGDEKEVSLEPAEGYGERDPQEVVEVPRGDFPSDFELVVGKPVSVEDHEAGNNYVAYIAKINPESVMLDFNHPLAGKALHFKVKVIDLRNASEDELAHGHVHS